MEIAPKNSLYHDPLCPYTQALLSAIPSPDPNLQRKRIILEGMCRAPSTRRRMPLCEQVLCQGRSLRRRRPDLRETLPGHFCACHRYDNIDASCIAGLARRDPIRCGPTELRARGRS